VIVHKTVIGSQNVVEDDVDCSLCHLTDKIIVPIFLVMNRLDE